MDFVFVFLTIWSWHGQPWKTLFLCRAQLWSYNTHTSHWVLVLLENFLEDVFEAAIIGFQDGVLGAHVQRPLLLNGILEAAVSKSPDRLYNNKRKSKNWGFSPFQRTRHASYSYLISVVHPHPTAPRVKVIHIPFLLFASISWGENDPELSWFVNDKISCSVLRSKNIKSDGWWDCSSVLTLKDFSKQVCFSPDHQKRVCRLLWAESTQELGEGCFYRGLAHGKLYHPKYSWWFHLGSSTSSLA